MRLGVSSTLWGSRRSWRRTATISNHIFIKLRYLLTKLESDCQVGGQQSASQTQGNICWLSNTTPESRLSPTQRDCNTGCIRGICIRSTKYIGKRAIYILVGSLAQLQLFFALQTSCLVLWVTHNSWAWCKLSSYTKVFVPKITFYEIFLVFYLNNIVVLVHRDSIADDETSFEKHFSPLEQL